MKYEFLEHTADIKFRAFGNSLNEAFENSVLAFSSFVSRGEKIVSRRRKTIEIEGEDKENLFYNFLEALIGLLDDGFAVSRGRIEIRGKKLKAVLFGDDVDNYSGLDHVKAATYSEMFVGRNGKVWEVQAVLDV